MRLQFVGSGDAFGSGGRFNTCLHASGGGVNFVIDCGATSLVAMKRLGIERNAIDLILLTHFHADHCGGVPFFLLDAQFVAHRTRPLTIAGPPPIKDWFPRAMDTAFTGSLSTVQAFDITIIELASGATWQFNGAMICPVVVSHGQPVGSYFGYRIKFGDRVLAFSGDTEWTDNLIPLGRDADLFVTEASTYDKPVPLHLAYRQLVEKLPLIRPKRLLLTHMGEDMLGRGDAIEHTTASDGLIVEF